MLTWQIMIGAQAISVLVSMAVVVGFMLKKEPVTDAGMQESKESEVVVAAA